MINELSEGLVVELKIDLKDGINLITEGNDAVILDSWEEEGKTYFEIEVIGLEETGSWKVEANEIKPIKPRTVLESTPSKENPMPFTDEQKGKKLGERQDVVEYWEGVKRYFFIEGRAGAVLELLWDDGELHIYDSVEDRRQDEDITRFLKADVDPEESRTPITNKSLGLLEEYVAGNVEGDLYFSGNMKEGNNKGDFKMKESRKESRSKRLSEVRRRRKLKEKKNLNEMDKYLKAELEGVQSSMRSETEKPADRFDPDMMRRYLRTWEEVKNNG